jgi:hypothetical protein
LLDIIVVRYHEVHNGMKRRPKARDKDEGLAKGIMYPI